MKATRGAFGFPIWMGSLFLLSRLTGFAHAGKNANGALVVHTNDAVIYTYSGNYCGAGFDDPGTCENAGTRTDKDENTPAVIWFLAAFPDTSNPAVGVIYFGIDHNLPSGEGYFANWGYCGPAGSLQIPDAGWPESVMAGNSLAFGSPIVGDTLFPFYWFAAYGFAGAYLGTGMNPTGGYAAFVDDGNPPMMDQINLFGTVRWFASGSNNCPGRGGDGGDDPDNPDGGGTDGGDTEGAEQWLDGDDESQWQRDCIVARLREDLPVPPREPVAELGIPSFDELGRQLGMVSARRSLNLSEELCYRYPLGARIVTIRFAPGADEVAVAHAFEQLSEVAWAHPNYVYSLIPFADPNILKQWYLQDPPGNAVTCMDWKPNCCAECDIGAETAWQHSSGSSSVRVAFLDSGADMEAPDLLGAWLVNPGEDINGVGAGGLCAPPTGDLDELDNDGDEVVDDVQVGYNYRSFPSETRTWRHPATWHGTNVASLLGAVRNNQYAIASVAGGDATNGIPGIRLIQFSAGVILGTALPDMFHWAADRWGARIFSTSMGLAGPGAPEVVEAVEELQAQMLFVAAVGNNAQTPFENAFAMVPGVMAVGGYDCAGGRWVIPRQTDSYPYEGWRGSDYGDQLSLMGPTDDNNPRDQQQNEIHYARVVMAAADSTTPKQDGVPQYVCNPDWTDRVDCFGGTSAAGPIVASVAAQVLSYWDEHGLGLTPEQVRKVLERTAEDVQCDTLLAPSGCKALRENN